VNKVLKVNHTELEAILKKAFELKEPLYIWGGTGIGKSQTARKVAREVAKALGKQYSERPEDINDESKFVFIDRRLSQMEPSDLLGLPEIFVVVRDREGREAEIPIKLVGRYDISGNGYQIVAFKTRWLTPNWLPKRGTGIIFLDEFNLAPPSIQAAAYELVLDRRLGDYIVPTEFLIIAAGNRAEDRANIFELARPLANRFNHAELKPPSIEEWTEWAMNHNIDTRILMFLKWRPALLLKEDIGDEKAFPTPRSWEKASKWIGDVKDLNIAEKLLATAVGEGAASEFRAFLKLTMKVDIKRLFEKPESIKDIKEIDMIYATLSAVIEYFKKDKKQLQQIVKMAIHLQPEFGMLLLRSIKNKEPQFFKNNVLSIPEWRTISPEVVKYCET